MKILLVAGARPNFMKIVPIIDAINAYNAAQNHNQSTNRPIDYILLHTGQHYDDKMSRLFFDELKIPKPDINLGVGSASHAEQTAEIMKHFEPIIKEEQPDIVIVVGDVNSTIACSLVASKIRYNHHLPFTISYSKPLVAHVEAGLRSFDRSMPEEINRLLTDAIADILFTTEESANQNLKSEGIPEEKIYFVGNVMIDTLLKHKQKAQESKILHKLGLLNPKSQIQNLKSRNNHLPFTIHNSTVTPYAVLTLHRPSNVDEKETFQDILEALLVIAKELPIIFPIHPRTLKRIHEFGFESYFDFSLGNPKSKIQNKRIHCVNPLGYLDFLHLMTNAKLVLTDSGGIQEETTILGVPCVTLRENTERPVTITKGTNIIAGAKKENIIKSALSQLNLATSRSHTHSKVPLWDGKAGKRIIDILIHRSKGKI